MPSNCSRSLGPAVGSVTTVRVNALPVLQTTRFCTLWISVIVDARVTPRNEPDDENSLTVPLTRTRSPMVTATGAPGSKTKTPSDVCASASHVASGSCR